MRKCCGTCKWWEHTYKNSSLVQPTMGSCTKLVDYKKLPFAFMASWKGWTAVDRTDGDRCPTYKKGPTP